jgi:hypothetical protein
VATSGLGFKNIIKKLRRGEGESLAIKELLLDKNISTTEKLELIKVKVKYALKNLTGRKRITFICTLVALLVFF